MEKAPPARPFPGFRFLRTCSFLVYPRVLWITGLAFLRKESPLAAAERPSVASRERGSGRAPELAFSPYASVRHFTPDMAHFSYNPH